MGSIFFPLMYSSPFLIHSFLLKIYSTVQKLGYRSRFQHANDVLPFIAYCVTGFKTVFHGLIF